MKTTFTPIFSGIFTVSFALGLWLLTGNSQNTHPLVLKIGALFICVGVIGLFFKGFSNYKRNKNILSSFILPVTIGIGLAIFLQLIEHFVRYLDFPYPLDDGEGFCLNQAVIIASGQKLYPPIGPAPYIVTNYPPVFPLIVGLLTNPDNPGFFAGRMVSVFSTVAIMLCSAACVGIATGKNRLSSLTVWLVVSSPVLYFWGALHRIDVLASALTMIGLYFAMSANGKRIYLSVPFFLAALYTRQSSVEGFIAVARAIALQFSLSGKIDSGKIGSGGLRKAILFTVLWVVGAVLILLLLQISTHGEFWRHTVEYTRTRFFPGRIIAAMEWIIPPHAILFALALLALPYALKNSRRRILGIFFLASLATSLLSGKVGSDLNYFLNLAIAAGCLAGCFAHDCIEAASKTDLKSKWAMAVFLLIPGALIQSGLLEGDRAYSFTPIAEYYKAGAFITEILGQDKGPILCEDEGFCLLSGHKVIFNPFIMSELAREGVWDQAPLVNSIESKEFKRIMLRFDVNDPSNDDKPGAGGNAGWDRFTPEMEKAISENYEIDRNFVNPIFMRRWWFIYKPKSSGEEFTAPGGKNLLDNGG
ncbi:MAG: hypothetical protein ABIC40_08595 [bacterium]